MVTSQAKVKRRVRGKPALIEREVFFKGMVYVIEEEVQSDSDNSSVYTSEDEFDVDKNISKIFYKAFPFMNKVTAQKAVDQQDAKYRTQQKIMYPEWMINLHLFPNTKEEPFLTIAQKDYQNKLLPKQYIEKLKTQRIRKFNETEYGNAHKALAKKKRRTRRRLIEKLEDEL